MLSRHKKTDLAKLLDQYEREHPVVAWKRLKYAVNALLPFWAAKTPSDINILSCRQYAAHRMDKGTALSTIARELTVLRAACHHAFKWERIEKVPSFELPTDLPKREVWLFKDELRALIAAADPRTRLFIQLAYFTGSRKGAIETLEWSQINFERRTINLAKAGEKKTCKRRPTVPMGDLYDLLYELFPKRVNQWVLGSSGKVTVNFDKAGRKARLYRVDARDGRPAGRVTPHVLRHSRATHLLEDGASIFAVSKLLGDTASTVQQVYGHICMSSLEDELNKSKGVL